jgi:hypothetical protein
MKKLDFDPFKTVLTISVGFVFLFAILQKNSGLTIRENWPLVIALIIGGSSLLSSKIANQINFLWMKLTWLLSLIVPNIILGIVFFLFLTPMALFGRLFSKKDLLILKNNKNSTFIKSDKSFDKESFEKPW